MNREFNQEAFQSTFNKHKKLLMESISSSADDAIKAIEKDAKKDDEYSHSPEMRVRSDEPEPFGYGEKDVNEYSPSGKGDKIDYSDQLRIAYDKAKKQKNPEAMAYYRQVMGGDTAANVTFEKFKGSWAYEQWLKKPNTVKDIEAAASDLKRFSFRESTNDSMGRKVRISAGSGVDSDKIVTIVNKSNIKTDGKGVPTNVRGAYKPVDWSKEDAIQYDDGSFGTMFKNRLMPIDTANEISDLKENSNDDPLYVEYVRDMPSETPFELGGKKYQFVMAKYPNGKEDIGVYAYAGDIVYGYKAWKQMNNIKAESASMGEPTGMYESIELTKTGLEDDWNRPTYKSADGKTYVDINLGEGEPEIYAVTHEGEPEYPIKNFKVVKDNSRPALDKTCPSCKNKKSVVHYTKKAKMCKNCGWKNFKDLMAVLGKDEEPMNESVPPNFPPKFKDSLLKKYKSNPSKAYATMWKLSKKYGDKLDEVVVGMKSDQCDIVNEIGDHDETDMSNPEEKQEVEIGKEMSRLAKKLVKMHKK